MLIRHSEFLFDRQGVFASQLQGLIASNFRLEVDLFFAISGLLPGSERSGLRGS